MHEVIADILKNMCTAAKIKMCFHIFLCQRNEMMNRRVSANCPNDKPFSSTTSLKCRIDLLIMRDSVREYEALNMVLDLFGINIPVWTKNHIILKETENTQKCVYHEQIYLIKNIWYQESKIKTQFMQGKNNNLKEMIYTEGHTLNTEIIEIYAKKHGAKTPCKYDA